MSLESETLESLDRKLSTLAREFAILQSYIAIKYGLDFQQFYAGQVAQLDKNSIDIDNVDVEMGVKTEELDDEISILPTQEEEFVADTTENIKTEVDEVEGNYPQFHYVYEEVDQPAIVSNPLELGLGEAVRAEVVNLGTGFSAAIPTTSRGQNVCGNKDISSSRFLISNHPNTNFQPQETDDLQRGQGTAVNVNGSLIGSSPLSYPVKPIKWRAITRLHPYLPMKYSMVDSNKVTQAVPAPQIVTPPIPVGLVKKCNTRQDAVRSETFAAHRKNRKGHNTVPGPKLKSTFTLEDNRCQICKKVIEGGCEDLTEHLKVHYIHTRSNFANKLKCCICGHSVPRACLDRMIVHCRVHIRRAQLELEQVPS